jgi:hypothetical protein
MNKFKTFTIGFIMGSLLIGGVTFASNKHVIEVIFPTITYFINGVEIKPYPNQNVPTTIKYKGFNYVPIRFIADALNQEIRWDADKNQILVEDGKAASFEPLTIDQVDQDIKTWVEASYNKEMVQVRTAGKHSYILITRGLKSTSGFDILVKSVKQHQDSTIVNVQYVDPPKGALLVEQMTYPYKLLKISDASIGHVTVKETTGRFIPHLKGLDYIPSRIQAETDNITVFKPVKEADGLVLKGAVRTFEGVLGYNGLNSENEVIKEDTILAEGAAPNWAYFELKLLPEELMELSSVQIYTLSAKDGSKHEIVTLPLSGHKLD